MLLAAAMLAMSAVPYPAAADSIDKLRAEIEALRRENALLRERDRVAKENAALRDRIARRNASATGESRVANKREPAATEAYATNLPVKAPVYPAPAAYSWTGCYLGAHVGGGWGEQQVEQLLAPPAVLTRPAGLVAGGQIGCDYQINAWVLGIEGQLSWANLKGKSHRVPGPGTQFISTGEIDGLATVTGRVGYAFERVLPYVKAGFAWGDSKYVLDANDGGLAIPALFSGDRGVVGWTVGGGVEVAFLPNLSWKIEYNYIDLRTNAFDIVCSSGTLCGPVGIPIPKDVKQQVQTVLVGVNYRFGLPAVAARY